MYFFRPVLSKVKDKSVISLPGWVAMAIPVIEETPISQMSQVGSGISQVMSSSDLCGYSNNSSILL